MTGVNKQTKQCRWTPRYTKSTLTSAQTEKHSRIIQNNAIFKNKITKTNKNGQAPKTENLHLASIRAPSRRRKPP